MYFVTIWRQSDIEQFIANSIYWGTFDDSHAGWGHRYTTLRGDATMVNIGISWTDYCSFPVIVEHYETPPKITWTKNQNFKVQRLR